MNTINIWHCSLYRIKLKNNIQTTIHIFGFRDVKFSVYFDDFGSNQVFDAFQS